MKRSSLAAFASVVLVAIGLFGAARAQIAAGQPTAARNASAPGDPSDRLVVAPGKVRFAQTRGLRWLELTPGWSNGESLIEDGGFAVYADAPDGSLIELVNTGSRALNLAASARKLSKYREGMAQGSRAPSLDPDDDHDGRSDEDRLDGLDNDRDGMVDEDFAAIGDEMVATEAYAREPSGAWRVDVHGEAYGWSLPSLDGTVMLSLRIRFDQPLSNVRVVAFYNRPGNHDLKETTVECQSGRRRARATTVMSSGGNGALALIPFPAAGNEMAAWEPGFAQAGESLSAAVIRTIEDRARHTEAREAMEPRRADGGVVYHVSPAIRSLAAGAEIRVDCALVATPRPALFDEAATNALLTYLGDGENRYLPQPLAVKPRLIWGRYRALPDEPGTVAFELEKSEGAISPDHISYFTGAGSMDIQKDVNPSSEPAWTLRGDMASEMLGENNRATLKGRLDSGEFFELVLRPESGAQPTTSDEAYWRIPGKLPQEHLGSSPNPFRNSTTVFYEVPSEITQADGSVLRSSGNFETSVTVFSVSGRLVNTLVESRLFPGLYSVDWSATDERGNAVASGVYYIKLQIEKKFITKRIILLK